MDDNFYYITTKLILEIADLPFCLSNLKTSIPPSSPTFIDDTSLNISNNRTKLS